MAEILRGKHKGKQGTIHQYCNDWFTIDIEDGPMGVVISPVSLRLNWPEVAMVLEKMEAGKTGTMTREFQLDPIKGTFRRIVPRRRRS